MKLAMDFYIVADRAWHGRIKGRTVGLASYEAAGSHPAVARCPKAQAVAADPSKRARGASPLSSEAYLRGEALAYYGLRDLFECAAEQIGRAERLSP